MNKYYIPIHSFVDLITNSSTEIYVAAHQKSATMLKELIDQLLKVDGSKSTADDYFNITVEDGKCICKDGNCKYCSLEDYNEFEECCGECSTEMSLVITSKVKETPEIKKLLETLNGLTKLFTYGERPN